MNPDLLMETLKRHWKYASAHHDIYALQVIKWLMDNRHTYQRDGIVPEYADTYAGLMHHFAVCDIYESQREAA